MADRSERAPSSSAAAAASSSCGNADDAPACRPQHVHLDDVPSSSSSSNSLPREERHHALSIFNDDLLMAILSFVADVPFESGAEMSPRSTLTHVLPLVSKQFHSLSSRHDVWWRDALIRLVRKEAFLWEEGLHRLILDAKRRTADVAGGRNGRNRIGVVANAARPGINTVQAQAIDLTAQADGDDDDDAGGKEGMDGNANEMRASERAGDNSLTYEEQLLAKARRAFAQNPPPDHTASTTGVHQCIFRHVVWNHLRFTASVFYMPGTVRLGREFGLHFFEPRYRLLISEVMSNYPVAARRGEPIVVDSKRNFPSFVYANHAPLAPTSPACIVQVRQCLIRPNGTADVFLVPTAYVWVERVWERPGTGGLCEARVVRMGRDASRALEHTVLAAQAAADGVGFYEGMEFADEDDDDEEEGGGEEAANETGAEAGNGNGVRGSIYSILAYLEARQEGMQMHDTDESEEE